MKKIKQVYLSKSVESFRDQLKEKYKLIDFYDKNEPVFIFGMHREEDYTFASSHIPYKIIFWCGSDSMNKNTLNKLHNIKNVTHIAGSRFVSNDLKKYDINHKVIPITTASFDLPLCPRGDSIYFYHCSKKDAFFYGMNHIDYIKNKTNIDIIFTEYNTYSHSQLIKIYQKCFIGLRLTEHDGIPTTVCELGLMGRRIIHNGDQPNAINYTDIDHVVELIKNEFTLRHEDNNHIANEMRKFLNVSDSWLYI